VRWSIRDDFENGTAQKRGYHKAEKDGDEVGRHTGTEEDVMNDAGAARTRAARETTRRRALSVALWALQVLLALVFAMAGARQGVR
jgi:hypothetical protein